MLQLLAGKDAGEGKGAVRFERHRPEQTLLYRLVEQYYPDFEMQWASEGRVLPDYVCQEFEEYLKCGRLEHGFLRVQCETCHAEHLVAFSCKRRGFCPSCGARRMAESAALLVDEVLPNRPMRQWVLSVPFPLRFLFASRRSWARRWVLSTVPLRHILSTKQVIRNQRLTPVRSL